MRYTTRAVPVPRVQKLLDILDKLLLQSSFENHGIETSGFARSHATSIMMGGRVKMCVVLTNQRRFHYRQNDASPSRDQTESDITELVVLPEEIARPSSSTTVCDGDADGTARDET